MSYEKLRTGPGARAAAQQTKRWVSLRARPDSGRQRAINNSDAWWRSCALAALHEAARTGQPFTAWTLTDVYGVPDPDSPNRWGALFTLAHRRGVIVPAGYAQSDRPSRAGGVCRQWCGRRPGA